MTAYLGIRYARPPFGALRFQAPVPVWDGSPRGAFGPIAPQSARLPGAPVWRPGDEDVLTLNVWTPDAQGQKLSVSTGRMKAGDPLGGDACASAPVLVWLHGGANTFGSSAQPEYEGTRLAGHGLVVVTCNFRLGFEGFGAVPGAPRNRALLDILTVLRWVQRRIADFGGDPGNVTVAGHSSGAQALACLLTMPEARGLLHRAIAHSMPGRFHTPEQAEEIAAGIDASTPESAVRTSGTLIYQPVVDVPPFGPRIDVDLLVCHTSEEEFAESTMKLADGHGNAHRAVFHRPPATHGADLPHMFHGDIGETWARFARTGDPGWSRDEIHHWH